MLWICRKCERQTVVLVIEPHTQYYECMRCGFYQETIPKNITTAQKKV